MKKVFRVLAILFVVTLIVAVATACTIGGNGDKTDDEKPERKVISVSVDKNTIPVGAYSGDVRLSQITLLVMYDELDEDGNNVVEKVALAEEYLGAGCAAKLKLKGMQKIDVVYENCKCSFNVYLLDPDDVNVNLTIEGGRPISVDGVKITQTFDGDVYSGYFAKGSTVTINWNEIEGKVFSYWTCDGKVIDNQRTTSVVMDDNKTYKAFCEDFTYSVNFVTFNPNVNVPQYKAKTIDSANDIKAEMTMEDYVFMGWTEKEITREEATSGQITDGFVEFPYEIKKDATFYAVWTPTGFAYTSVSVLYAGKKVDGKAIVSYDGALTELSVPAQSDGQNVIAITKDAFSGANAKKLTKITIPSTIISIEEGAFNNCSSLQSFNVDAGSQVFSHERGVLYMNQRSVLLAYPAGRVAATYSLEAQVTEISDYAFYNAVLGSISVQSAVTFIGSHAFDSAHIDHVDFTKLKASDLKIVGNDLFSEQISSVYVGFDEENAYKSMFPTVYDKIVTDLGKVNSVYSDENDNGEVMLFRLINGKYFDVRERTAEIIGFTRTTKEVTIPDATEINGVEYLVSSIAEYAFKDCISLQNVVLPKELERVCDNAFDDTPWIKKPENVAIIANETLYKYIGEKTADGKVKDVYVLDPRVKRIAEGAFNNNKALRIVDVSENAVLERIDAFAFDGCVNLKGFTSDGSDILFIKNPLRIIDEYAFRGTAIKGIETQIASQNENGQFLAVGDFAFADCRYLEKADIKSNILAEVGTNSFTGCYSLEAINVSVENNKYNSFDGILYEITGRNGNENVYTLFRYPSAKMLGSFNPSKPGENEIYVTSLGEYCLEYANIGALEIEESVSFTNANSVFVPSLTFVKFNTKTTLNDALYERILGSSDPEKIVFSEALSNNYVNAFFGRDAELINDKATTVVPYEFETVNGLLIAKKTDYSAIKIVGSDRSSDADELVVPQVITVKNGENSDISFDKKSIGGYAFFGYNLKTLIVNSVDRFESNALGGAFGLKTLDIETLVGGNLIPAIDETSFGENYEDRITVVVKNDPEEENGYFDAWRGLIDTFTYVDESGNVRTAAKNLIYGQPFFVLTYLDKDEKSHTALICRDVVTEEELNSLNGKRGGYSVGGWISVTEKGEIIDFSEIGADGYKIEKNMVIRCEWIADEYTVYFVITDDITLNFGEKSPEKVDENKYKYVLKFGEKYDFSVIDANQNVYNFEKWQSEDGTTKVEIKGEWSTVLDGSEIVLVPLRTEKEYKIIYDRSVTVIENGQIVREKIVYYGKQYKLGIPEAEGYEFVEWQMLTEDGECLTLTDSNGVGLTEWRIASNEGVTVYPKWKAKDITVTLYLTSYKEQDNKRLYMKTQATYGDDGYVFGLTINDIPQEYRTEYVDLIEFFAGWSDVNGLIYTDATGAAIREWDKVNDAEMYAVWPQFVDGYEKLKEVIDSDDKASIVLVNDVTVGENRFAEYNGVFNGNNHSVFVNATSENGGLFDVNNGTIKNVRFVIDVDFALSDTKTTRFGGICGLNNGFVENVNAEITSDVEIGAFSGTFFFGGLVGINAGELKQISYTVNGFELSVAGGDGVPYVGSVVGLNKSYVGVDVEIHGFKVLYDGKPYARQTDTIGSVAGSNALITESGAVTEGVFVGSCRLTGVSYAEEYETYEESADASKAYSEGRWESVYGELYYYSGNKICPANETYSSEITYYKKVTTKKDIFLNSGNRFGANRGGNYAEFSFSTVEK